MKKLIILSLLAGLCFSGMSFKEAAKTEQGIEQLSPEMVYASEYIKKIQVDEANMLFSPYQTISILDKDQYCSECVWQICGGGGYKYQKFCWFPGTPWYSCVSCEV